MSRQRAFKCCCRHWCGARVAIFPAKSGTSPSRNRWLVTQKGLSFFVGKNEVGGGCVNNTKVINIKIDEPFFLKFPPDRRRWKLGPFLLCRPTTQRWGRVLWGSLMEIRNVIKLRYQYGFEKASLLGVVVAPLESVLRGWGEVGSVEETKVITLFR